MSIDALNIAGSSLAASQRAMDVIANNIANVNTPGYSRQSGQLVTYTPDRVGNLIFGRGVDLQGVSRMVDPLIDRAQQRNASQGEFYQTLTSGLNVVENVFGSLESTGLAAGLDDFFLAWQSLANNPQDQAQKFNVRSKSETLSNMFSSMNQQLVDATNSADAQIDQQITGANQLLTQIASLSAQIKNQESALSGNVGQANDLRDSRDQAVRNLATIIPIQQVDAGDGGLLIQTLGGDLLVQDGMARTLARSSSVGSSGFREIVIAGSNTPVSGIDKGGAVGGLIELRDNKFGEYTQALDSIAANLIFSINQVQASGVGSSRMSGFTSGQPAAQPAVALDSAVQNNAFASQIQSGSFNFYLYDASGAPVTAGGTTITITAGTTTMNDVASSLNAIAGVTASVDSVGRLVVDAGVNTIGFSNDTSNFLAAYEINTIFSGQSAGTLKLSDSIINDASKISTGIIDSTTSVIQPGDNRSAIAITAIQNTAISFDGTPANSLFERTSILSSRYGTDVAVADQQRVYRQAEAESLAKQRQSVSGVNVDEELISMMKFQRAYEASAKVIQTTNTMLDTLMGLIR